MPRFFVMSKHRTWGRYKTLKGARKGRKEAKKYYTEEMSIIKGGESAWFRKLGLRSPEKRKLAPRLVGKLMR